MYAMNRSRQERRLHKQASAWAMRLGGGALDQAEQRRLDRWLAADPRHGPALADAEMAWALAGECRDSPLFAQPVPAARRLSWSGWLAPWRDSGAPWRWAGAALCLVLTAGWVAGGGDAVAPLLADYKTSAGEVRPLALPDGSQVLLGSNSALDVQYGPEERRVRLLRGEAVFSPAPRTGAETRKFVVEAAGGRATALGTRYAVHRENAERAWVGVLAHRVEVELDAVPQSGAERMALEAGDSAVYSHAGGIVRSQEAPRQGADWAEGYLVFEGAPLDQVLRRVGDFKRGLLILADREAARRPVTGLFHLDNLDGAIATLCAELRLKQVRLPGVTLLY